MKKIVLTTTAVLSLLATGATISSVNASSSPAPQTNTQSDSIIATDVTLVEKREAKFKEQLMIYLNRQLVYNWLMKIIVVILKINSQTFLKNV